MTKKWYSGVNDKPVDVTVLSNVANVPNAHGVLLVRKSDLGKVWVVGTSRNGWKYLVWSGKTTKGATAWIAASPSWYSYSIIDAR